MADLVNQKWTEIDGARVLPSEIQTTDTVGMLMLSRLDTCLTVDVECSG